MKKWLVVFLLIQISCVNRNAQEGFQLHQGDLLFQDLDSSPLCDAIELVTPGYKGASLSHIGMIVELGDPYCINPDYNYNDHVRVLEALPNKVRITSIDMSKLLLTNQKEYYLLFQLPHQLFEK